jgi:hypothetical protein
MRRQTYILLLIVLCAIAEIMLIQTVPFLESYNHPLLSSLTCLETENRDDLYWTMNQIEITDTTSRDGNNVIITLRNTIPHFAGYIYRSDIGEPWQDLQGNQLVLEIAEGQGLLEIKGTTLFGVELPPATFLLAIEDDAVIVTSDQPKIIEGRYSFSFENAHSPKMKWLQGYTLPVITDVENQWDMYSALRTWVREQIPYKDPVMKSQWDAQRILQAVWDDSSVGFICDAFAATYVSACVSVGLNARMIHLGDSRGFGHYATEVWSDDHHKWVFMDPLYNCHFTLHGVPLSVVELHDLWKKGEFGKLEKWGDNNEKLDHNTTSMDYFNLLQDIQVINANNFLSTPHTSVFDLLTLKIRYLRWVDESNPRYDRVNVACRIAFLYYLPKLLKGFIIPIVLPGFIVFFTVRALRKKKP